MHVRSRLGGGPWQCLARHPCLVAVGTANDPAATPPLTCHTCRLVAVLDDLHEQLAAVRVEAALACDPMAPEERAALAQELAALPTAQLEAALGLILPQVGATQGV